MTADNKFEKKYKAVTETTEVTIPKNKAWFFEIVPDGIGLRQVLDIKISKSTSYHIFRVPAAPAPNATANNDNIAFIKLTSIGAINRPTTQVKITSDITRGFINWNNPRR